MGHDTLTVRIWRGPALQERTRVFIPANTGPAALADKTKRGMLNVLTLPLRLCVIVWHFNKPAQTSFCFFKFKPHAYALTSVYRRWLDAWAHGFSSRLKTRPVIIDRRGISRRNGFVLVSQRNQCLRNVVALTPRLMISRGRKGGADRSDTGKKNNNNNNLLTHLKGRVCRKTKSELLISTQPFAHTAGSCLVTETAWARC